MQLPMGRTERGSAQGLERILGSSLFSTLLLYTLINMTVASPKILHPADNTVITKDGKSLQILCSAQTKYTRFYNIYWLVNKTFVEDAYPDGRVTEQSGAALAVNMTVKQTLNFTSLQPEDFRTTFTCLVVDPSGTDMRHFSLFPENDGDIRLIVIRDDEEPKQER
ncbi:interleukin-18-binding protein [Ranitomeya variabilis]|uniref:interleukin-18-binding protein n=1 Tax=Ranitomeya variabilis TaxID=490064 RepID=UPI0040561BA3